MMIHFRRFVAMLLIVALAAPLPAYAGMVGTEDLVQRERIQAFFDRADVQAQLAARIDELPAGGIGIIGAILVVFLVLLLTDILGYTKIFPFTRSAR